MFKFASSCTKIRKNTDVEIRLLMQIFIVMQHVKLATDNLLFGMEILFI